MYNVHVMVRCRDKKELCVSAAVRAAPRRAAPHRAAGTPPPYLFISLVRINRLCGHLSVLQQYKNHIDVRVVFRLIIIYMVLWIEINVNCCILFLFILMAGWRPECGRAPPLVTDR